MGQLLVEVDQLEPARASILDRSTPAASTTFSDEESATVTSTVTSRGGPPSLSLATSAQDCNPRRRRGPAPVADLERLGLSFERIRVLGCVLEPGKKIERMVFSLPRDTAR